MLWTQRDICLPLYFDVRTANVNDQDGTRGRSNRPIRHISLPFVVPSLNHKYKQQLASRISYRTYNLIVNYATELSLDDLRPWIGRIETRRDQVTAAPIRALSATLDREDPDPQAGDPLPPLWHWLYFLPIYRQSELGPDGHVKRGRFQPPVSLPRRMWAGGRFEFFHPLRVGQEITRESRIEDITLKPGRSGPLVFVLVRHEIHNAEGLAMTEEHDIVFRGVTDSPQDRTNDPQETPHWTRTIYPDDTFLFRYSALTFNAHRIHYDRRYATQEERYPGLVVHGPLVATLLVDLLLRSVPNVTLKRFEFRAVSPLFDTGAFTVCGRHEGRRIALWAQNSEQKLAVKAEAQI